MSIFHEYVPQSINRILDACRQYNVIMSIIETDSIDPFNILIESSPISDIQNIEKFKPRGLTPLFDVLIRAIKYTSSKTEDNKILVVLSDGFNNKSNQYSERDIQNIIAESDVKLITTAHNLISKTVNPTISIKTKTQISDYIEKCRTNFDTIHFKLHNVLIGEKNEDIQRTPTKTTWKSKKKRNSSQFRTFLG